MVKLAHKEYVENVEQKNASLCFARAARNIKMACTISVCVE
jgi:hypothetical protein